MVAFLVALLAGCSFEPKIPAGDPVRPDVIIVSIDTLRADHLSAYGHDRPTSPFLDKLAADGTRFAHARSTSPWTLPAHTTMLSGQLPTTHQVTDDHLSLDVGVAVLPEVMKQAGYRTGASVATLYVSRKFGFERGFDFFDDHGITSEKINLSGSVTADKVISSAVDWIEDVPAGEPVFLFLHFYDVHYHYDPPAPFSTMFDRAPARGDRRFKNYYAHKKKPLTPAQKAHQLAQYDESIRYVDDELQKLHKLLGDAGRKSRWVVTSDHGEEFGERGSWGHAHSLYAEQLRVPLIISGEGLPSGVVVPEAVGIHDIAPTVASWVGGVLPQADGIDLAPAMGGAAVPVRPFPAETFRFKTRRISLYEAGLRIEWDVKKDRRELFASDEDLLEQTDLSQLRPADLARMAKRVEAVFGQPWVANVAGEVLPKKGTFLSGGAHKRGQVEAGQRFQVLPYDARVRFKQRASAGPALGPWRSTGKQPPHGGPLSFEATASTSDVTLDAETRKKLEALGYVQGDD
jgi:arylsulfatase A-like enzyme